MGVTLAEMASRHPEAVQTWLHGPGEPRDRIPTSTSSKRPNSKIIGGATASVVLGAILVAARIQSAHTEPVNVAPTPVPLTSHQKSEKPSVIPRNPLAKLQQQIEDRFNRGKERLGKSVAVVKTPIARIQVTGDVPTIVRDFPDTKLGEQIPDPKFPNSDGGFYFKVKRPYNDRVDKTDKLKTFVPGGFSTFVVVKDMNATFSVWAAHFVETTQASLVKVTSNGSIIFEGKLDNPNGYMEYFCVYHENEHNPELAQIYIEDPNNPSGISQISIDELLLQAAPSVLLPAPLELSKS